MTTNGKPNLAAFDVILVNSSAGKDSQAMLDEVCRLAREAGVLDRVVVVHSNLGRVEWKGTASLARRQADFYGVPYREASRPQGDLLTHVRARKRWPDSARRYCTSDHKRGQVQTVITQLGREVLAGERARRPGARRRVRVLNCLGMRAEESPARSKLASFEYDARASSRARRVWRWLPLHGWKVGEVWARIKASGCEHHEAYDLGMPRLSCCFCIFAPKAALMLAGKHNPELLAEYVAVEKEIGHSFTKRLPIIEIQNALASGACVDKVTDWQM